MLNKPDLGLLSDDYAQLKLRFDNKFKAMWFTINPKPRPCFNLDLLAELRHFQNELEQVNRQAIARNEPVPIRYTVLASSVPGVFNFGGDLELFSQLIQKHDRVGLQQYATACIDVLYPNAVNFHQPLTTMTLVQGDALGGGFEAAISSNVVIAERSATFGLPEIIFNLIPGMGAYTFLIRRVSPDVVERLITSGRTLSAEQMLELRLVDVLAEDGQGEKAVNDFLFAHHRRSNAEAALQRVRQLVNPVTYEELIDITHIWVDAAMQLTNRDLRLIARLVRAQSRVVEPDGDSSKAMEGRG